MGLLENIKKAGLQGVDSTNPVNIIFGDVISVNPLEINVEQRFTLTSEFLILTETLTPYSVYIPLSHSHGYTDNTYSEANGNSVVNKQTNNSLGTVQITIRIGLKVRDKVILLRIQGGQKYLVLDKVGS